MTADTPRTELLGQPGDDFGDSLCPPAADVYWNIWSASYPEAQALRQERDGYLLPYRHHFFVVERDYLEFLGFDPGDSEWASIGRDWAGPADPDARQRLFERWIQATAG